MSALGWIVGAVVVLGLVVLAAWGIEQMAEGVQRER